MTPEQTLTAAATKLREAATAAQHDVTTADFWSCYPPATAWQDGLLNGFGGVAGDYAALMRPGVGTAIADWLDSAAEDATQIGADHRALAVARAILGEQP